MKWEKPLLRPPTPENTSGSGLLLAAHSSVRKRSEGSGRTAFHRLSTLPSPLCPLVFVCVCMCKCVFDALKMVRSLVCLVTIPTSLPVFLRVKAPFLSRFLLQLLGRRPELLPARRPPPHDPASPFLLGSVSEAAERLTL